MQNYFPFANGMKRTVKSRPTLQLEGAPLTEMPEDVKESWLRMNWPDLLPISGSFIASATEFTADLT